ncbi:MAG: sulfatase [Isosphaeraceae bacterium]
MTRLPPPLGDQPSVQDERPRKDRGPTENIPMAVTSPQARFRIALHRRFRNRVTHDESHEGVEDYKNRLLGWRALILASITFGIVAGFLDLATNLIDWGIEQRVDDARLRASRHYLWMLPLADTLIITLLILLLAAPARLLAGYRTSNPSALKRLRFWIGAVMGTGLFLPSLMAIRGLADGAALLLAIGLGSQVGRFLTAIRPRTDRWIHRAGLASIGFLLIFAAVDYRRVVARPSRAWSVASPGSESPSLIWIVLDTTRADRLGLYGYERDTTPHLTRWAARGITFDDARSPATWTLPSHVTMFTGLWPSEHGARVNRRYSGRQPTIAEFLGDRGYTTGGFVANTGMCNSIYGVGRGFDTYVEFPLSHEIRLDLILYNSDLGREFLHRLKKLGLPGTPPDIYPGQRNSGEITGWADAWLKRTDERAAEGDRPFFLFLNFMDAHSPYICSHEESRAYSGDRPALDRRQANPTYAWNRLRKAEEAPEADKPSLMAGYEEARRLISDLYDDCIREMDSELGRFLDDLDVSGKLANTWVVITADHGEAFGEHGTFGHGVNMHSEITHIPLVVIPPAGDRDQAKFLGTRVSATVSTRDLPATLMSVMEAGLRHPFPGRDLSRLWQGSGTEDPGADLCEMHRQPLQGEDVEASLVRSGAAVFHEGYALIEAEKAPPELYHLADDPQQKHNLADRPDQADRIARLRKLRDRLIHPESAEAAILP